MARLIWSAQAAADLQSICEYVGRDSEVFARLLARRITAIVETIPRFPMAGRKVPEFDRGDIRERIIGAYRVIYQLRPGVVEVVTILHGARNLRG
jgi:plasmid stabilization system protein ParE